MNLALPTIRTDLGGGISGAQWTIDGYNVTFAAVLLTSGSLGDRFGTRALLRLGLTTFVAASVACAMAHSLPLLLAARALQGIGAGFMLPQGLAITTHAFSRNRRAGLANDEPYRPGSASLDGRQPRAMGHLSICGACVAIGVYVVLISKGVEVVSSFGMSAADLQQAEYFWQLIDSRKAEVCELLEAELDELSRNQRTGCLNGVRHHQRMVKKFKAELRTLDRMLLALRVRLDMPLRRTM